MKARLFGAIATIALVASLSSAQAEIVDVTFTGTVTSGFNGTGVGTPAVNLTGYSYQAVYRFDLSQGHSYFSPTYNYVVGGSSYGNSPPSLGAVETLSNGVNTYIASVTGTWGSRLIGDDNSNPAGLTASAGDFTDNANVSISNGINNSINSKVMPIDIRSPFTYNIQTGDAPNSNYDNLYTFDKTTNTTLVDFAFYVTDTAVTLSVEGAPGPAPGAGLASLAFLALVGVASRYRSRLV